MAQVMFRRPGDPPKKEMVRKHLFQRKLKRNVLIALYLLQTGLTVVYIYARL